MNTVLYLSTRSTSRVATKNANLSQVSWPVSWNDMFPTAHGLSTMYQVYIKLKSQKAVSTNLPFNSLGSLRCSLSSNYNINNFGSVLGLLDVVSDVEDASNYSVVCDTSQYSAVLSFNQPTQNGTFTLYFCDNTEALVASTVTIPDFECMLIFQPLEPVINA